MGTQTHPLLEEEVLWFQNLPRTTGVVLRRLIAPHSALHLLVVSQKMVHAVDPGPVLGMADQTLLDPLGEEVAQAPELGFRLIGDDDVLVTAIPQFAPPAVKTAYLASDVAVDEPHELAQLLGALGHDEHVVVIREKREAADVDLGTPLAATENPENRPIHLP